MSNSFGQKQTNKLFKILFVSLVSLCLFGTIFSFNFAEAAANPQINYQGKLTNVSGVAVPDGTYNMRFWLLTSGSIATSSALWTESLVGANKVTVSNGLFSIMLGSTTALTSVDFNQTLYLGVEIGGTSTPAWDGEMSPRKILGTVPAAFVANYAVVSGAASSSDNALSVGGVASSSFLRSDEADTMVATSTSALLTLIQNGIGAVARFFSGATEVFTILNNGNVGIGSSTPTAKLSVVGDMFLTGIASSTGLRTGNASTTNLTVSGLFYSPNTINFPGVGAVSTLTRVGNHALTLTTTGNTNVTLPAGTSTLANLESTQTFTGAKTFSNATVTFSANTALLSFSSATGNKTISTGGTTNLILSPGGNVGIGTTTPGTKLAVVGDTFLGGNLTVSGLTALNNLTANNATTSNLTVSNLTLTGGLRDSANATGTLGMILQTTGTSTRWIATSTLGLGSNTFLGLLDTPSSYTTNRILFTNSSATALTDSTNFVFDGTNLGIGSTTPSARLTVQGAAGSANIATFASSTGSTTLALLSNGNLELPGQLISAGIDWTARSAASSTVQFNDITYGNGTFVVVGDGYAMYSSDGINWIDGSAIGNDDWWLGVTYGNGLFVAVSGSGSSNRIMTSPDGINWTARVAPGNSVWRSVTYGNGLFVAVASTGTVYVMTSPDGINWTARSAAQLNYWNSVTYGNGLFVAVASNGANRVMTSPDGITWTAHSAVGNDDFWRSVTYGNGLFVAVADSFNDRVMTSPNGITWTVRSAVGDNDRWNDITYGNGLFVAVSGSGDRVMTSPDGINWTARSAAGNNDSWNAVTYGNGLFVAVDDGPSTDHVMTSGKMNERQLAHNNIYQGGTSFMGGLRAGTTSTSVASSIFLQSEAGRNPFAIASSSGTELFSILQNGNVGIGTTTPGTKLAVVGDTYLGGNLTVSGLTALNNLTANNATTSNLTVSNLTLTGGLRDSANATGTLGMILQATGTSTRWIATSTLGLGNNTFLGLLDTPSSYTANRILFTNSSATALTDSANFVFDGNNLGIGTSSPASRLDVWGNFTVGTGTVAALAINTAANTLTSNAQIIVNRNMLFNGGPGPTDNVIYLGTTSPSSVDASFGFFAAGVGSANASQGAYYLARGNDYTASVNQRGNMYFVAGNPWTPGINEGSINFWTGTDIPRMIIDRSGRVGIGTVAPNSLLEVSSSAGGITNGLRLINTGLGSQSMNLYPGTASPDAGSLTFGDGSGWKFNIAKNSDSGATKFMTIVDTGNVGIGTSTPSSKLTVQGTAGSANDLFTIASSSGTQLFSILQNGNVGIGTSTPLGKLHVVANGVGANDLSAKILFSSNSSNWGQMQLGNPNYKEVSLAYIGNVTAFAGDPGPTSSSGNSFVWNQGIGLYDSLGSQYSIANKAYGGPSFLIDSAGGVAIGTYATSAHITKPPTNGLIVSGNVGIGTTTPNAKLTVQGTAGTENVATFASSTGSTTLALLANGNMELPGQLISAGIDWTTRSAAGNDDSWEAVTYGNGLFVAVSASGDRVMTSLDGINWATSSAAGNDDLWYAVTYGNGLFVAVGYSVGSGDRVMTSPDGINWTARSAAGNDDRWRGITYANGLFVAVGVLGDDRVMTSPDGINWTRRTAAGDNDLWGSVVYANGLFVAVGAAGGDRVITSPDGVNWTARSAAGNDDQWYAITYGNGLFVAVGVLGDRVMTSPDGINWTVRSVASNDDYWRSITYGDGLFVAVGYASSSDSIMTSPDGINWTVRNGGGSTDNWNSVAYANGLFVALGENGNRVMTSGKMNERQLAHNNIYQGGASFMGGLRAGTTSTSVASSIFLQSEAGKNPFAIASSSGAELFSILQNGNVGIGSSTPNGKLAIQNLNFSGSGVAGINQYFTLNNSVASAVQYGNYSSIVTSNTATTTIAGNMFKIADSTTFGNTIRGLEVQTDKGSNTQGENTALSGFARTFGVRGTTQGDAGGTYEPAGVYGETLGTTQGNALRGYSSTITTASLLKLFQDTSTFTGTGLLMNFGNSGGSFSSTTASRFIDLKNGGTSKFTVGAYGMLTIGDGSTTTNAGIQIGYGGLCVDNDGACNASTTGRISSVSTATGNSDLAEMYFASESLLPGEVVYLKSGLSVGLAGTTTREKVLGVVSTLPGVIMGQNDSSLNAGEIAYPIALAGRVPVRLSNENGDIKAGDELMVSSIPGVVMKASSTGIVVGRALEDFVSSRAYSDTYINQFGESIITPEYVPINRVEDERIDDGCYFGGGRATGEETCIPLKATTPAEQYDEADALARAAAKAAALEALRTEQSAVVTLASGETVQVGQIVMFVDLHYRYLDEGRINMLAALLATTTTPSALSENVGETIWERLVNLANNFVDGVLRILTLKADRVETKELCVDGVCVNANDLQILLNNAGAGTGTGAAGADGSAGTGSGTGTGADLAPPNPPEGEGTGTGTSTGTSTGNVGEGGQGEGEVGDGVGGETGTGAGTETGEGVGSGNGTTTPSVVPTPPPLPPTSPTTPPTESPVTPPEPEITEPPVAPSTPVAPPTNATST